MTPSILDDVMFCADAVPAIVSTRARMMPIEREIMEVSLPFSPALGPHPQRELSLTPRLGFTRPRLRVAAGAFSLALGPHPQRELSLTPRLGFTRPRLRVAAGAFSLALGPPQRPIADASPRIHLSSARRGRRRVWSLALLFAWTRTSQAVPVHSVHLLADLGKRPHRRLQARFRHQA